jgi:hypothetical protein
MKEFCPRNGGNGYFDRTSGKAPREIPNRLVIGPRENGYSIGDCEEMIRKITNNLLGGSVVSLLAGHYYFGNHKPRAFWREEIRPCLMEAPNYYL